MTNRKLLRMDPYEQPLIVLREELDRRGVRCELDDRGSWPRLRIYCPGETPGADFDNNVVTAREYMAPAPPRPATVGDVMELCRRGQLASIPGLGRRRSGEIEAGLVLAGLVFSNPATT